MVSNDAITRNLAVSIELLHSQQQKLHSQQQQLHSQQQQLDRLSQRVMQLQNEPRQIPPIGELSKAEDLQSWRDNLTQMLKRYGLDQYICNDVPEPQDDDLARLRWLKDRRDVDEYIQTTVPDQEVWNTLRGLGWSAQDSNPKKTFDLVIRHFKNVNGDDFVKLHRELVNARPRDFDNLASFRTRISYLKERLEDTDFSMNDKAYTWIALNGIASDYSDLHARCVARIRTHTLTWNDLMAEFHGQLAGGEEARAPAAGDRRDLNILLDSVVLSSQWLELTFPAGSERLVNEYCIEVNRKRSRGRTRTAYVLDALGQPRTARRIKVPAPRHVTVTEHPESNFALRFEHTRRAARFKKYAILFDYPSNNTPDRETLILPAKPEEYLREELSSPGSKLVRYRWYMWFQSLGVKFW